MVGIVRRTWAAIVCAGLVGAGGWAVAADRTPPQILAELDAIRMPAYEQARQAEPGYREKIEREMFAAAGRRDALIYELYRVDPDNARLPLLMQERWRRNPPIGENEARFQKEIDDVLARSHNEGLRSEALFARARPTSSRAARRASSSWPESSSSSRPIRLTSAGPCCSTWAVSSRATTR